MQVSDRQRFVAALGTLATAYRHDAGEVWFEAYWLALKDLNIEAVEAACAASLASERFLPAPATIRDKALGSAKSAASEAWESVRLQIRSVGYVGTPKLDELSSRIVRALGGWERLCSSESTELDFIGKDFRAMYEDRAERVEFQKQLTTRAPFQLPKVGT